MTADLNRERFVKLIALAESDQDGEALAAIRKAAAMAREAGMSLGQAVGVDAEPPPVFTGADIELSMARLRIADLERKLAAGPDEARMEAEHIKGYQRGHKAGRAEIEREVRMVADSRIREVEAELEAFRQPLDWPTLAERFHHKNQRGLRAPFAKGVLLRAMTNKLTPADQAELRKFAEPKRGNRKAAS